MNRYLWNLAWGFPLVLGLVLAGQFNILFYILIVALVWDHVQYLWMLLRKTTKSLGSPRFEHLLFPLLTFACGLFFNMPAPVFWLAGIDSIMDFTQDVGGKFDNRWIVAVGAIMGILLLLYKYSEGFIYWM